MPLLFSRPRIFPARPTGGHQTGFGGPETAGGDPLAGIPAFAFMSQTGMGVLAPEAGGEKIYSVDARIDIGGVS
jgi:hypothetical protein